MAKKKQDFVVEGLASPVDDNTVVLTSGEDIEKRSMDMLLAAMQKYEYTKEQYSVQFSGTSAGDELTLSRLKELLRGINSSLSNVTTLNQYIHQYILQDDVLGATHTALKSNINTEYVLSYNSAEGRSHVFIAGPDAVSSKQAGKCLLHTANFHHIVFDLNGSVGANILGAEFHLTRNRVGVAFVAAKIGQTVSILFVLRHDGHIDQRFGLLQCAVRRQQYAVQIGGIVEAHAIYQVKVGLRFRQFHNFTGQYDFLLIQLLHLPSFWSQRNTPSVLTRMGKALVLVYQKGRRVQRRPLR